MHAAISPPGVLPDQTQHQDTDGTHSRRPTRPLGPGPGRVPLPDQVTMPAQHSVRADQQPHPAQGLRPQPMQQRRRQSPVRRSEPDPPLAQLAFQNRNLMPQGEDLGVLVPIARRKKTQDRERVRHRQVGQSQQHSRSSCRDDHLAMIIPALYQGDEPQPFGDTGRHGPHLHGRSFRHAQARELVSGHDARCFPSATWGRNPANLDSAHPCHGQPGRAASHAAWHPEDSSVAPQPRSRGYPSGWLPAARSRHRR